MPGDYFIHKGAKLRLHPKVEVEPSLKTLVDEAFGKHDCLKAYSIFSAQYGWIFWKRHRLLCLVYEGAEFYRLANAELTKSFEAYFQTHSGFLDLIGLDAADKEQGAFASNLMAKLPFKKKADPVGTDNDGAAPRRV